VTFIERIHSLIDITMQYSQQNKLKQNITKISSTF